MNILFLSQILPYPLNAGPKVRAYYVLRHLARHHQVTLLAFTRPDDSSEALDHLRAFCEGVHKVSIYRSRLGDARSLAGSLLAGQPFVIRRDSVPAMMQKVDGLLATGVFDAIHADQLWMAQYALRAKSLASNSQSPIPRLVLDEHNACYVIFQRLAQGEHNPFKRALLEREWRALARYEAWACGQFDRVITVTDKDQEAIASQISNLRSRSFAPQFTTIPICIDPSEAPPVEPLPTACDVLHLGTMFFLPNAEGVLWFTRQVWPRVMAQVDEATFTVVGKNPPKEVERIGEPANGRVRVTGYVPDPHAYLKQAAVFVVPLHSGGGMRVKILDAWRWGLPVVSTTLGAEGIDYRDGENILVADDAESFARAVVRVLREPALAQRLRENGRWWVEGRYDWRKVYIALDRVYER